MQGTLFNQENAALQPMYFWFGQIVDDSTWKDNELREKWQNNEGIPGWGSRFRIRIFGRDIGDVANSRLDMAECMYPVTSGSGHAASYQTTNLRKGTYVIGFYRDGIDREDPVIIGCLGNSDQTKLSQTIPLKPFEPHSGFVGEGVSYYSIPSTKGQPLEGNTGSSTAQDSVNDQQQKDDGERQNAIMSKCDPAELKGIQLQIKNLIKDIENAKKQVKDWKNTVLKPINYNGQQMSVSDYIQMKIANVSKDVSKFFKNIIDGIRKFTTEKINNTMKDTYFFLFPNERPGLKEKIETASNLISCLFNKIISNLLKMVGKALLSMVDRVINTAECLINNFVGGLLGKLVGLIGSALSDILRPIEALVGGAFDIAAGVLDFVKQLLGFFTCEEKPSCSQLKEWSIWGGTGLSKSLNFTDLFNKVKEFATTGQQLVNPNNFNFDLDFSDIFQDSCNLGPILCGPPSVVFYGGGGAGASANAIISATGDILGIDIISSGFGYTKPPFIRFEDACGKGSAAVGRVSIGPVSKQLGSSVSQQSDEIYVSDANGTTNGVIQVVIEQTGTGYLSSPNGDLGGDGRVWATRCQSYILRSNGTYDTPYDPGEIMQINVGDTVTLAGEPLYVATQDQSITAPECPPSSKQVGNNSLVNQPNNSLVNQPSSTTAQYPVVLYMCSTKIVNSGIGYSDSDTIIVSPSNGAILQPLFGPFGSLEDVKIISSGMGFTERPNIYIESQTGYNAQIVPVFCVNRIGDVPEEELISTSGGGKTTGSSNSPIGEKIINVIDCVGKV
jgi:hypothetical protein